MHYQLAEELTKFQALFVQSAGTVEYTDGFSAEGLDTHNECPVYDTKQYDGEVPVMLGLWEMPCTPSLPLLPGQLKPEMVAPDRALFMGWIELTAYLC